jgi:hypothetical protein
VAKAAHLAACVLSRFAVTIAVTFDHPARQPHCTIYYDAMQHLLVMFPQFFAMNGVGQ